MNEKKNTANWKRLNEIFQNALALRPEEQREFLQRTCAGETALRGEVEELLAASRQVSLDGFLEKNAFGAGARILAQNEIVDALVQKKIGKYKIIREIGRGGMGAVYLAEREDFRQKVALKIIKRGMDTDEIIRRFRRERQVLASLNHPNIAHLLDGGTTDDGLPFFVMEYVEGLPVTEFCDQKKLSIEERLELFRKVCQAVGYAHQHLIVHRDIKPSNILITKDREPKLLDFGISKLLGHDALGVTVEETAADVRLLTPEYASPEQIRGERVTTVSDIYSLGVLLYELLSGHRPIRLKNRSSIEILRIVSEVEPAAPSSVAVETVGNGADRDTKEILSPKTIADSRRERPEKLRRRLRGDLDNIVLMSLRKEPGRRYQTVEQLDEDLRRHLERLPVLARPSTFVYHLSKFVRRNQAGVAGGGLAVLALLIGFSIAVWQAHVARSERARAEKQLHNVRQLANRLITDFDKDVQDLPGSLPARLKLAQTSADYLNNLAQETDEPAVLRELAESHHRLGTVYAISLSNPDEAKVHIDRAIEIARRLAAEKPDDLSLKGFLASTLTSYGQPRAEWEQIKREAVRLREEIAAASPDDIQALTDLTDTYIGLGIFLHEAGRREESLSYYRRAIDTRQRQIELLENRASSPDEFDVLFWAHLWIGIMEASNFDNWPAALQTFRKAVELSDTSAARFPEHRKTQTNVHMAHSWLAKAFEQNGGYHNALEQYQFCLRSNKENGLRFNTNWRHLDVRYRLKIARVLQKMGQQEQAWSYLQEALKIRRETTENDYANPRSKHAHAAAFYDAGTIFASGGKFREARAAFREAESYWATALETSPDERDVRSLFAGLYLSLGDLYADCQPDSVDIKTTAPVRLREALEAYRKAVRLFEKLQADDLITIEQVEKKRLAAIKMAACAKRLGE